MFDFVRHRARFYLALGDSIVLPGLISLVLPGGLRPGIDFTGGTIMTISIRSTGPGGCAASRLSPVQATPRPSSSTRPATNAFVVRTRPLAQANATARRAIEPSERQQLEEALTQQFGALQILNLDQVLRR